MTFPPNGKHQDVVHYRADLYEEAGLETAGKRGRTCWLPVKKLQSDDLYGYVVRGERGKRPFVSNWAPFFAIAWR